MKFSLFWFISQLKLCTLHEHLLTLSLPAEWMVRLCEHPHELQMFEVHRQKQPNCEPIVVTRSLIIFENLTWEIYIHGHKLDRLQCSAVSNVTDTITFDTFKELLSVITGYNVCCGNPDHKFVEMAEAKKGKFLSIGKNIVAYSDIGHCVLVDGVVYPSTVRHSKCEYLVMEMRCKACSDYRNNLRAIYSNFSKQKSWHASANTRYLQTPQKAKKLSSLKRALLNRKRQLQRLNIKLQAITKQHGVHVDEQLQNDLQGIINANNDDIMKLPVHDFRRIFWEQQVAIISMFHCMHVLIKYYTL